MSVNPNSQTPASVESATINANILGQMVQESQVSPKVMSISFLVIGILLLLAGIVLLAVPGVLPVIATSLGAISIGIGAALLSLSISIYVFKKRQPMKQIIDLTQQLLDARKVLASKNSELKSVNELFSSETAELSDEIKELKGTLKKLRQDECVLRERLRLALETQDFLSEENRKEQDAKVSIGDELFLERRKSKTLENRNKDLEEKTKQQEQKLAELSEIKQVLEERSVRMCNSHAELTKEVGDLQCEVAALNDILRLTEANLELANKEVGDIERTNQKLLKETQQQKQKIESQALLISNLKKNVDLLAEEEKVKVQLLAEVKDLRKQLEDKLTLLNSLKQNLDILTQEGGAVGGAPAGAPQQARVPGDEPQEPPPPSIRGALEGVQGALGAAWSKFLEKKKDKDS